jgi:hypothetical protein
VLANFRWIGTNKTEIGGRKRLAEVSQVVRRRGGGGLPAFFRLEIVRLSCQEALTSIRAGDFLSFFRAAAGAVGAVTSWRACVSLLHPRTWRIIWAGYQLRSRTAGILPVVAAAPPVRPSAVHPPGDHVEVRIEPIVNALQNPAPRRLEPQLHGESRG